MGVPISSLPSSPSPAPATPTETTPEPAVDHDDGRTAEEPVKTSNLSVTDYFRQKMREKMLARQAAVSAHGEQQPAEEPKYSLANVKEEKKVAIGGVGWEGSKVNFNEEVKVELGDLGAHYIKDEPLESVEVKEERIEPVMVETTIETEPLAGPSGEVDEKAAKKARKEAKKLKKLAGGVKAERVSPEPEAVSVEDEETRAKREKKEKKEEKKRRQSEGGAEVVEKKRKRDRDDGEVKVKKEKKEKAKKERIE